MALGQRQLTNRLIHHSDRGAQYLSYEYQDVLKRHGIRRSMSDRGNCYENAAVESFFSRLKRERVDSVGYRTRDEARADVFDYIEMFYNRIRRHSHLAEVSPEAFERASF